MKKVLIELNDLVKVFDDEKVVITVSSPSNLDVEIHQALRGKYFFKEIYKRDLYIEKEKWQD